MKRALITGGSSGLGLAIKHRLTAEYWTVDDWSLELGVNVASEGSVELAARSLPAGANYDLLINCAGIVTLDWLGNLTEHDWDAVMGANAKSIFLVTKALTREQEGGQPRLKAGGTILNIVSNAADQPMTHSLLYNASKGAAKSMTMQMARELRQSHDLTVFGVSPNKMAGTGMSDAVDRRAAALRGITLEEAQAYQASRLPFGVETPVACVADFICWLVNRPERNRHLAGCIIPYGL
jgi:NAD(P)-dependent dehydrogenase (short-subunit alcohol dehydrogenase family)